MAKSENTVQPIPNKVYYKIGEVSAIAGVKPHVLRYWESEFKDIRPAKSKSRQRLYRKRDLHLILEIKKLLYEQRYTLEGAKKKLEKGVTQHAAVPESNVVTDDDRVRRSLREIREELEALSRLLSRV